MVENERTIVKRASDKLTSDEIKNRLAIVFFFEDDETPINAVLYDDGVVDVYYETEEGISTYNPDMTDRPEALSYLLGEQDSFND